jgi:hypothetical protein
MADAITTNVILLDRYPVIETEMRALQTESMIADQWHSLHRAAWRRVLQDISRKWPGMVEADVSDTTQLYDACIYWVLHLAYSAAEGDRGKERAKEFAERYEREIQELPLSINGTVVPPAPYTVRMWRG